MKQVILITGASSGIGKATAKRLIQDGHTVYSAARRLDQMVDLKAMGGHPIKMDITIESNIQEVVQTIHGQHGALDILINNAGYAIYGAMEDTSLDDARRQFEVNLFGLARLTQLVLPAMRERGKGRIINVSSMGGKIYTPLGSWYHATKHALEGWSDCLRLELKPFGIEVVIIEPGAIVTEFGDVMLEPMLKRSGQTAYGPMTQSVATATRESYKTGGGSAPEVISDLISKAVMARRPKTRYVAGKFARPLLFVRRFFSDRFFDRIIMSQVK